MTKDLKKGLNDKSISYYKKASVIQYDLLDEVDRNGGADTADYKVKSISIQRSDCPCGLDGN